MFEGLAAALDWKNATAEGGAWMTGERVGFLFFQSTPEARFARSVFFSVGMEIGWEAERRENRETGRFGPAAGRSASRVSMRK
jgi:hypothetical protein